MLEPLSHVIEQIANDMDVDCRLDYSGRFMYGKKCIALTGSLNQSMAVIAEVINQRYQEVISNARDADDDSAIDASYQEESQVVGEVEKLLNFQYDSMGLDVVVYWPKIQYEERNA